MIAILVAITIVVIIIAIIMNTSKTKESKKTEAEQTEKTIGSYNNQHFQHRPRRLSCYRTDVRQRRERSRNYEWFYHHKKIEYENQEDSNYFLDFFLILQQNTTRRK